MFKDAREHGELVAAWNHNDYFSGLANGTIEGLALVNEGKVIDSNLWRVIGVSNAVELAEINLETLLGAQLETFGGSSG